MNRKLAIALVGVGVLAGAGLATAGVAGATESTELPRGVRSIVEKFNLNKDEVIKTLEADRFAHQAERQQEFATKLDEAVAAGKITAAQKEAIIKKHDEIRAKRVQGNREANQALRTEFSEWLKSQGIDESVVKPNGPQGGRGNGQGRGMHRFNQYK